MSDPWSPATSAALFGRIIPENFLKLIRSAEDVISGVGYL